MRPRLAVLFLILCAVLAGIPGAADVIDRIVATVNGHIILQSDWEDEVRYEAFCNARPLDQITPNDRKATLDRLIDQELLREQMTSADVQHPGKDAIADRVAEIRDHWPGLKTDAGWKNALRAYGLTEDELQDRVRSELEIMQLVDEKLRPSVKIDAASVEEYYNQELLPTIHQMGIKPPTLDSASPHIKELLTQKRMNELLVAWLQKLRADNRVESPQENEPQ